MTTKFNDAWRVDEASGDLMAELPLLLPVRKKRLWVVAAGSFVLLALCTWLYVATKDLVALGLVIFFAAMLLVSLVASRRNRALRIDEAGFALVGGAKETAPTLWQDTSGFGTMRIGFNTFVSYQFTEASGRTRLPGGMALPGGFDLQPDALAALLNLCHARFAGHGATKG